ncbi:hypothetical protein HYS79_02265 [Patescibacteria group bacterium]|nr:hypothetical protein [Patescibacteria group bacterium]
MGKKFLVVAGLVGVGIAGRLLPHAPNTTPITAITIAAQKHLGKWWAFAVPMVAMIASDAVLGFYDWKVLASVYGSFLLIGIMSRFVRKHSSALSVAGLAVAASILFFLITNASVWLFSPWYEKSLSGLFYSYTLGLPFLRNMLIGDLVYTFALLGVFNLSAVKAAAAERFLWLAAEWRPASLPWSMRKSPRRR